MEVVKIYHVKCVSITKMIHKSNSITGTTHFLYYLLNMGLPFYRFAILLTWMGGGGEFLNSILCLKIFFSLATRCTMGK